MDNSVVVLNVDDSVSTQTGLVQAFKPQVVDLYAFHSSARFWLTQRTMEQMNTAMGPHTKPALTFLGSRDFHHLTALQLKRYIHPITLVVFDDYIDWEFTYPRIAARGWLNAVLGQVNVVQVIICGIYSQSVLGPWLSASKNRLLKKGRVKVFDVGHMPKENEWPGLIPSDDVYISLDKSCLKADEHVGNGIGGQCALEDVLKAISTLREKKNILGVDVCGDFSLPVTKNPFKAIYSKYKYPKRLLKAQKSPEEIRSINERVNVRIAQALIRLS